MILRRITEHVREQNWFAVGLDFVIVVIGVFIGIQVANWNAERIERTVERALIESLEHDFRAIIAADAARYERTIAAPNDLARVIDAARSGQEPERSVVWPGLEAVLLTYAVTPPSPTYDELLSTGRLSRLTNQPLRRQLSEFERSRSNEAGLAAHLIELSYGSPLYAHVDLDTFDTGLGLSGTYRWEGVKKTLPQLQERLVFLHALASWRRNSRKQAEEILGLIENELK